MFKRIALTAATLAFTFLGISGEAAAATEQQTAATSCVITSGASLANAGTTVAFTGTNTGSIILHCPVDVNLASFDSIEVSYRDSDGASNTAKVDVMVTRVAKSTAAVTPFVVFGSHLYSSTVWHNQAQGLASTFTFDHDTYYYYIEIVLSRNSSASVASVGHVKLFTI